MPKFAANLTMLFTEHPFDQRVERAAAAGFKAVEVLFPYGEDTGQLKESLDRNGVELVNFNIPVGDMAAGDRGFANDPRRVDEFREAVNMAIELAGKLECPKLNCLVGKSLADVPVSQQWDTLQENLSYAATQTEKAGIRQLIEPLNTIDNPGFLICTPRRGFSLIDEIGHPNLFVEYDLYHAQRMEGNLTSTIRDHIGQIGHVQIADSPDRHEPGTGELNYPYLFGVLDAVGYSGWVSLEYNPSASTEGSLQWMEDISR